MSEETKSEVASLAVKVSAIAAVLVETPLDIVLDVMTIVTAVESYVHA